MCCFAQCTKSAGFGLTVNIPLPPYSGDRAYRAVLDKIFLPVLERFNPEMLLVSVGFDAHWRDPLGSILLSAQVYYGLLRSLVEYSQANCGGKIGIILEGGYDLDAAAACGLATVDALLGLDFVDPLGPAKYRETDAWEAVVGSAVKLFEL
jgi:acetoin utilization deacetylase AcuC-like enzyme